MGPKKYRKPRRDSMLGYCEEVIDVNTGRLTFAKRDLQSGGSKQRAIACIAEVLKSMADCKHTINTGEYPGTV